MKISEIRNPQIFQVLCQSLLCAEFKDTQIVRDSSGDGGIDAYVPSTKTLYAMYCPKNVPTPKGYFQRKIRKDLEKAVKLRDQKGYDITIWIFLTPEPMEEDLHRYLGSKISEAGFAEGANQSELHLQDMLLRHSHLRSQFPILILPDVESSLQEIQAGIREKKKRTPEDEFSYYTSQALRTIHNKLSGFEHSLPRPEISWIEDQWRLGKAVLLSGESGTGKSGIAANLARQASKPVLLLDARNVALLGDEPLLRQYFNSTDPLSQTIISLAQNTGFRLIIDQLDNLIGKESANLIINLALECAEVKAIEVIVISRNKEAYEARLLHRLTAEGFVEIESRKLREGDVTNVLAVIGINSPTQELIRLGQNLLNLEIICLIRQEHPDFDFSTTDSEIKMWEKYLEVLQEREAREHGIDHAELLMARVAELARVSLKTGGLEFQLGATINPVERSLVSWGVVIHLEGRFYRFGHERLQDYIYARDMCDQRNMPSVIQTEIGYHRMRNILPLMEAIYTARKSASLTPFLKEVFNV